VDGTPTRTVLDTAVASTIAGYEPNDRHGAAAEPQTAQAACSRPPRLSVRLALSAPLGVPVDERTIAATRAAGRSPNST
jgi:hypothetical protein